MSFGGAATDVNVTIDCVTCEVWFDLGGATPSDSFVACVKSNIARRHCAWSKGCYHSCSDVVSINIGCIVIIWIVALGIVGDDGVNIKVFSVVETSVYVVLKIPLNPMKFLLNLYLE